MPTESKASPYHIERTGDFDMQLSEQEREHVDEIEEAIKAIAASPTSPEPRDSYKLLRRRATGMVNLSLAIVPKRMRLVRSGFEIKYTVREFERRVILEDLDREWIFKLPQFQPSA